MEQDEMRLRPGAEIYRDSGGWGLRMGGSDRRAKDALQAVILQALQDRHGRLDELLGAVGGCLPDKTPLRMASLALADFVLDFGNYLEE